MKIGNDIVDIQCQDIHPSQKHPRFLERVFHPIEIKFITAFNYNPYLIWSIWAAKEAAYKAMHKIRNDLIFSHQNFILTGEALENLAHKPVNNSLQGELYCQSEHATLALQWNSLCNEYVHCIACACNTETVVNFESIKPHIILKSAMPDIREMTGVMSREELTITPSLESLETHYQLKKLLSHHGKIEIWRSPCVINGNKRRGPPCIKLNDKILPLEISMSHDGRWIAIIIEEDL